MRTVAERGDSGNSSSGETAAPETKWPSKGRRISIAIGVATAIVVVLAALLPRSYIVNDDIGLTEYLRSSYDAPWLSPILARGLGLAYDYAPGLPWLGLYEYALIIATGAILIYSCIELIDRRPGLARYATRVGAIVLVVSLGTLATGLTWTTASIYALGTATAAFVAHIQVCHTAGQPLSRLRSLGHGLLLVNGYMLRPQGMLAMLVTLLPLLGWGLWWCWRRRCRLRASAVAALVAPLALVLAIQGHIPHARHEDRAYDRFNALRGRIHDQAAFGLLDARAPDLLARAGWSVNEYRDFMNWLIIDEADYPPAKLQRLIDTGGVPESIGLGWSAQLLRGIATDSAASVWLFLSCVVGGVTLALAGAIHRWRGIVFCLIYLAHLVVLPLWMAAHLRFPQRVSLAIYAVAALGVFCFVARELADRTQPPARALGRRDAFALVLVTSFLLAWAWHFVGWLRRAPPTDPTVLQPLEDRIAARGGFVFVYIGAGLVEFDPLRARPRAYGALQGGWGTFSTLWYDALKPLGVHRGAEVLPAMLDNPNAYLLAWQGARGGLEEWLRRKLANPSVHLVVVDHAEITGGFRPELYRIVSLPLVRDSN
jgi:hypothetical protein